MTKPLPLTSIQADPGRFQFRDDPFSRDTVDAIVAEGIDEARFDPIPVILEGKRAVIGGDGHSRWEAIKRLAAEDRLPATWFDPKRGEHVIPCRPIDAEDALRITYVANMSRSPFTPCEEAGIFRARIEAGETIEEIARSSHRSVGYVRKRLTLEHLCRTIRAAVDKPWGIDTSKAIVIAEKCRDYGINHQVQQELWHKVLCKGDWTHRSLALFMDRIGRKIAERPAEDQGFFEGFELAANVDAVMQEVNDLAKKRCLARRGLQWLIRASEALEEFPDLASIVSERGPEIVDRIKAAEAEDADALGALIGS